MSPDVDTTRRSPLVEVEGDVGQFRCREVESAAIYLAASLNRAFCRGRMILLGAVPVDLSQLLAAGAAPNGPPQTRRRRRMRKNCAQKRFLPDF